MNPLQRYHRRVLRLTLVLLVVLMWAVVTGVCAFMRPPDPDECIPTSSTATVCLDGAVWTPCFERGDINMDGEVNLGDLVVLQRVVLGEVCPTGKYYSDMNRDGYINAGDILLLQRKILELD